MLQLLSLADKAFEEIAIMECLLCARQCIKPFICMISGNSQYISMNRAYCLKEHATTLSKAAPLSSLSYIGKVKVKVTHSDPMDCILGWVVIPFSSGSSQPKD